MKVSELFANLSYGELHGLSLALDGNGNIAPDRKAGVIRYANETLTMLYNKFTHNTSYVKLELQEGVTDYILDSAYAVSDTDPANTNPRYIQDSAEAPFPNNVLKVTAITATDLDGNAYPVRLNNLSEPTAVRTLSYNSFKVDQPVAGHVFEIEYQANHPRLSIPIDEEQQIHIAPLLEEALLSRVAAKIYMGIGGEDALSKAQALFRNYEYITALTTGRDMVQESVADNQDKLDRGGWK